MSIFCSILNRLGGADFLACKSKSIDSSPIRIKIKMTWAESKFFFIPYPLTFILQLCVSYQVFFLAHVMADFTGAWTIRAWSLTCDTFGYGCGTAKPLNSIDADGAVFLQLEFEITKLFLVDLIQYLASLSLERCKPEDFRIRGLGMTTVDIADRLKIC